MKEIKIQGILFRYAVLSLLVSSCTATSINSQSSRPRSSEPPTVPPPTTPAPPLERTLKLHQGARLPCDLPSRRSTTTPTWRHGDQLISPSSTHRYTVDPVSGYLNIANVRLEDGGLWQCVERDPTTERMLDAARPIRLTVTDSPREVYLEVDGRRLDPGNVFVPVVEGATLSVWCAAEGGHPPPRLSWLLQGRPLTTAMGRRGRSEAHLPQVARALHNASVTCVVHHEALAAPLNASVRLDVQYSPSFAITRVPGFGFPITEGIPVSLKCDVDSNPPSTPVWVKDDASPPVAQSPDGYLNFTAIKREHSGWYKCTSREFSSIGYFLNVRYEEEQAEEGAEEEEAPAPASHVRTLEVALGETVELTCPGKPAGCWARAGAGDALEPLGQGPVLTLSRVLYQEAGVYHCVRPDVDKWRVHLMVHLTVTGSPVVYPSNSSVLLEAGQRASLTVEFCANPPATKVQWLTATTVLRPGEGNSFLLAHPLEPSSSPYCHEATLTMASASRDVAGEYTLLVYSPRGIAAGSVAVEVSAATLARPPLLLLPLLLLLSLSCCRH